jgi:hypothetical protein
MTEIGASADGSRAAHAVPTSGAGAGSADRADASCRATLPAGVSGLRMGAVGAAAGREGQADVGGRAVHRRRGGDQEPASADLPTEPRRPVDPTGTVVAEAVGQDEVYGVYTLG